MPTYCPNCFVTIEPSAASCPSCGSAVSGWGRGMSETERLIHTLGHPDRKTRMASVTALAGLPSAEAASPLADLCFSLPDDVWQAVEVIRTLNAMPAVEKVEVALSRLALEHPMGAVQTLAEHVLDLRFGGAAA